MTEAEASLRRLVHERVRDAHVQEEIRAIAQTHTHKDAHRDAQGGMHTPHRHPGESSKDRGERSGANGSIPPSQRGSTALRPPQPAPAVRTYGPRCASPALWSASWSSCAQSRARMVSNEVGRAPFANGGKRDLCPRSPPEPREPLRLGPAKGQHLQLEIDCGSAWVECSAPAVSSSATMAVHVLFGSQVRSAFTLRLHSLPHPKCTAAPPHPRRSEQQRARVRRDLPPGPPRDRGRRTQPPRHGSPCCHAHR